MKPERCDLCGAPTEELPGDGWVCSEAGKTCWRRVLDLKWLLENEDD